MKHIHVLLVAAVSLSQAETSKIRVAHIGLEMDGGWSFMKQVQEEPGAELVAVADSWNGLAALLLPEPATTAISNGCWMK